MKCGGTAKYRLGGVIKYFTDGGTVTAPGSGGGAAGGGGGTTTGMAGAASTGGKSDVMSDITRLRQAKLNGVTVEEEKMLNEEFRNKYGEESMMALIAGNAISEGRYINQAAGAGFVMDGSEAYKKFGVENAKQDAKNYGNSVGGKALTEVANYIQGKTDDLSPDIANIFTMNQGDVLGDYKTGKKAITSFPTTTGQGAGGGMGAGNKVTTGIEDKSLPNWGRAKTQQAMLNKLIEADKSTDKPAMLKEDDIVGKMTTDAMDRYEKAGLYKRPALFSDENLKQYAANVKAGIKIKSDAKTPTDAAKPVTSTGGKTTIPTAPTGGKTAFEKSNEEYGKIAQDAIERHDNMRRKEWDEMLAPYADNTSTEEGYKKYKEKMDEYFEKYPGEYQEEKRKSGYLTEKDKRIKEGTIGRLGAFGASAPTTEQPKTTTKPTTKPIQKYGDITGALGGMGQGLGNIIDGIGSGLSSGFESMMDYAGKKFTPTTKMTDDQVNNPKETRQGNMPPQVYSGQMLTELKKEREALMMKIEQKKKQGKTYDNDPEVQKMSDRYMKLEDIIANSDSDVETDDTYKRYK
jgi:hypothetical protein